MRRHRFSMLAFILPILLISLASDTTYSTPSAKRLHGQGAEVDVAILLDTSNSMDGLISQAKSQLWTIIQQFARSVKNGQTPLLRVALFEYGNTNLPAGEGYIRQVVPLGDDLDVLSEALFSLTTKGGDEYCGQVMNEAITRLDWSTEADAYRVIFIAGNEPFTQGPVDYHHSCNRAVERSIIINTIHCGKHQDGVNGQWKQGARLAYGEFFNIDQDRVVVHIDCPQDPEIIRLNAELNETYLWFGSAEKREYYLSNQEAQDSNARRLSSSVAVGRSVTKSSKMYSNTTRDLVDALVDDTEILKNVPEEELPDIMREMTTEERAAYLEEMAEKRAELKKEIGEKAVEREAFLEKELKKRAEESGETTLGDAVVIAIRKQLVDAGFEITDGIGSN